MKLAAEAASGALGCLYAHILKFPAACGGDIRSNPRH
jgi:hypothetical protein